MIPTSPGDHGTSTRPYLIRALHSWCTDNEFTPYIAVFVDGGVQVPMDYVKNNEIVLNVGFEATHGMTLGNEYIEFKARFGGHSHDIMVPVDHVIAIYARENGQGMAFPMPTEMHLDAASQAQPPVVTGDRATGGASLRLASTDGQISAAQQADDDASVEAKNTVSHSEKDDVVPELPPEPPLPGGRPSLKRIK